MTHRVLLLTDIESIITGPDFRATPVLNHHVTRGVVPPAYGLRQSLSRFLPPLVPPMATLQGPRAPDPSSSWHAAHESPPLRGSSGRVWMSLLSAACSEGGQANENKASLLKTLVLMWVSASLLPRSYVSSNITIASENASAWLALTPYPGARMSPPMYKWHSTPASKLFGQTDPV